MLRGHTGLQRSATAILHGPGNMAERGVALFGKHARVSRGSVRAVPAGLDPMWGFGECSPDVQRERHVG
jgi:hypothetical protein